ncbi:MAG: hypothetical protein J6P16_05540 [Eubacterium sp.]|nr:hypothetical protein [Eubacterium sp.]
MNEKKELNDEELDDINGGARLGLSRKKGSFFCQYCSKSFDAQRELRSHIKKDHPGEPVVF